VDSERHEDQRARWPAAGKVILASFDDETVVVYQAFSPETAVPSVAAQRMCGRFSLERMSWIKPNFLWMMYRSGWASKEGQEHVLAVRIRRAGFDEALAAAVPSSYKPARWESRKAWELAVHRSDVRLQWDPDHGPGGEKLDRRAIQIGLRGEMLRRYVEEWTVSIEDITPFVHEQREVRRRDPAALLTPVEREYAVSPEIAANLGLGPRS
jgi:uncharacterized protein DUF4291